MKITRIETIPIQIPINPDRAIRGGRGAHTASPFLLVRMHTDEGLTGLGEVFCTPGWSGEDQVTAASTSPSSRCRTSMSPGIGAEEFPCDIFSPFLYEGDVLAEPLPITAGSARPTEQPSLGVALHEEKVAHYRIA